MVIRRAQDEIEAINLAKRDILVAREMMLQNGLDTLAKRSAVLDARKAYAEPDFAELDNALYIRDAFAQTEYDDLNLYARMPSWKD